MEKNVGVLAGRSIDRISEFHLASLPCFRHMYLPTSDPRRQVGSVQAVLHLAGVKGKTGDISRG